MSQIFLQNYEKFSKHERFLTKTLLLREEKTSIYQSMVTVSKILSDETKIPSDEKKNSIGRKNNSVGRKKNSVR